MNKTIHIEVNGHETECSLIENADDSLTVKAPVLQEGDEEDIIDFTEFEIPAGKKADVIRQFFEEEAVTIIRDEGKAYDLEHVLTDEVELPANIEPDEIE